VPNSIRRLAGALIYDAPRFERHVRGRWQLIRNRNERITVDESGRAVRCEWQWTSTVHYCDVFPDSSARLMGRVFDEWPIRLQDAPTVEGVPEVSFVIGHRGAARLPHLLMTLQSIAGQNGPAVECVVVEQSAERLIEQRIPKWVRYVHTPIPSPEEPYNRAWTLNAGAAVARGRILVLHDNDMVCPSRYAAEIVARIEDGWLFADLKRFTFYLDEADTSRVFTTGQIMKKARFSVVQNLRGASVVARADAFEAIGRFDQSFVGWGGEDNEFWERAATTGKVNEFGYLPFVHLFHAPQKEKLAGATAPAVQRYQQLKGIPPEERIAKLRNEML
jgi:hypothetical protein